MENWGLIMATASAYLLDPNRADEVGKRALASVQSHEIAHMWCVALISVCYLRERSN